MLKPADDRFCWIRAELSFTGLKQTLIEPELRVAIGSLPPPGPSASECIRELEVSGAPWPETGTISLNDGLVAIVGPKGSGKTALADIIARGAGATVHDGSSFLIKAYEHLGDATVTVHWTDGAASDDRLAAQPDPDSRPYVRYLSQQFVDRLCSSDNLGRELLEEIESVVYQAIAEEERLGAGSFTELRELRLEQVARARRMQLEDIQRYTESVAQEDQNKARLPALEKKLADLKAKIERDEKELARLLPKEKKAELASAASWTRASRRYCARTHLRSRLRTSARDTLRRFERFPSRADGALVEDHGPFDLFPRDRRSARTLGK